MTGPVMRFCGRSVMIQRQMPRLSFRCVAGWFARTLLELDLLAANVIVKARLALVQRTAQLFFQRGDLPQQTAYLVVHAAPLPESPD